MTFGQRIFICLHKKVGQRCTVSEKKKKTCGGRRGIVIYIPCSVLRSWSFIVKVLIFLPDVCCTFVLIISLSISICSITNHIPQQWPRTLWNRTIKAVTATLQKRKIKSINQSINTFITRHGTEARATVRIMPKQREMS